MPTLDWIGKQAVVKHHKEVLFRLPEPVAELGAGDPASGNLIVQCDNLHTLKVRQAEENEHQGFVKLETVYQSRNRSSTALERLAPHDRASVRSLERSEACTEKTFWPWEFSLMAASRNRGGKTGQKQPENPLKKPEQLFSGVEIAGSRKP